MDQPQNERGVAAAAQKVGTTDKPRIDSTETGYGIELSNNSTVDSALLSNFQEDAIDALSDREALKEWAENDK